MIEINQWANATLLMLLVIPGSILAQSRQNSDSPSGPCPAPATSPKCSFCQPATGPRRDSQSNRTGAGLQWASSSRDQTTQPAAQGTFGPTSLTLTPRSIDDKQPPCFAAAPVSPTLKSNHYRLNQAAGETGPSDPDQNPPAGGSASDAHELAKKLSNPVASLISVPFQSNFDFKMGAGSGWRYTLNIQPVIPFSLNANWNLITRTILPIIHQTQISGDTTQNALGDLTEEMFFSPKKTEPFIWGVGPALLIPTATDRLLGNGKWGLGPTVVVLKQREGWTYGLLMNQIWSIAGHSDRARVNSTFAQPFLSFTDKAAYTYQVNTESSYDWVGNHWSIPIHFQITKLTKFGNRPVSLGGGLRCWATSPAGGPNGCGFRFIGTLLFPK